MFLIHEDSLMFPSRQSETDIWITPIISVVLRVVKRQKAKLCKPVVT